LTAVVTSILSSPAACSTLRHCADRMPRCRPLFLLILRPPPRPTLFPYTTLFRSAVVHEVRARRERERGLGGRARYGAERLERERSEEHTSELQSLTNLVCRLLLEKKKKAATN